MSQYGLNKPASLTAALLARKGEAHPAMPRVNHHRLAEIQNCRSRRDDVDAINPAVQKASQQDIRAAHHAEAAEDAGISVSTGGQPGRRPVGAGDRVALTLRLDHDTHLRLKLLCAHLNQSSQQILKTAVDDVLKRHAQDTGQGCHCLSGTGSTRRCSL